MAERIAIGGRSRGSRRSEQHVLVDVLVGAQQAPELRELRAP